MQPIPSRIGLLLPSFAQMGQKPGEHRFPHGRFRAAPRAPVRQTGRPPRTPAWAPVAVRARCRLVSVFVADDCVIPRDVFDDDDIFHDRFVGLSHVDDTSFFAPA